MKTVTDGVRAEILSTSCRFVDMVEIDHPSGVVRLCNGVIPVWWNGNKFTAMGTLGRVTGIGYTTDLRAQEVTFEMAGPVLDVESLAVISQPVAGRLAAVYRAFLTPENQVIAEPVKLADVTLDTADIKAGDGQHTVVLMGHQTMAGAGRGMSVYYSNERQQTDFAGDTGFDQMANLADKKV